MKAKCARTSREVTRPMRGCRGDAVVGSLDDVSWFLILVHRKD